MRYGPTRDRVLEVDLVTGDGRIVRGGARVVKNVTGFDLPRLATGSLGGLGVIARVCLKLWPRPPVAATVYLPGGAHDDYGYRPLAVVVEADDTRVYLAGTADEVEARALEIGGDLRPGHEWPRPLAGVLQLSLRVPPRLVAEGLRRIGPECAYQAAPGAGEIKLGGTAWSGATADLREWAEGAGGALVLQSGPAALYEEVDPWGTPPSSLTLQRRLVAGFDPCRVVNPGRLPGGL